MGTSARIVVAADYPVAAAMLWQAAVRYDVLERMMSGPFVRVTCPPGEEQVGHDLTLVFRLFGRVPFGRWRLKVTQRDDTRRRLVSEESGLFVQSWRHEIAVDALSANTSRLTDTIDIDAGVLTSLIVRFARREYTRRHRLRLAALALSA
jgi:hypothetical protein